MISNKLTLLCAAAFALCGCLLVSSFRLPATTTARPSFGARVATGHRTSPFTSSSSSTAQYVFGQNGGEAPKRPTRDTEPQEYFKSNLEKKPMGERLVDPQVIIGVVSILAPFVAVGVLLGGGFLTR